MRNFLGGGVAGRYVAVGVGVFGDVRPFLTALFLLLLSACAGAGSATRAAPTDDFRVYDFSEAKTQKLVTGALRRSGVELEAAPDPHVLASRPIDTTTRAYDNRMMDNEIESQRTWVAVFQPRGAQATAVKISRGEQHVFGNDAAYSARTAFSGAALSAPSQIDARVEVPLLRDPEKEAEVALALDAEVDLEVSMAATGQAFVAPAAAPLADPTTPVERTVEPGCDLETDSLKQVLVAGHFVLLSDPIGAREPWEVLDQVLCVAQARKLPTTVAVAVPSTEQGSLNAYLGSSGAFEDRQRLLTSPFWVRDWQDGRSSEAFLAAVEKLRQRRAAGQPITVLAVDTNLSGNPRHAHVASALLRHRFEHPERVVVAMLGNVMTTRRAGAEWDATLLPVGARLSAVMAERTHAFDVAFDKGAHWTCRVGEPNLRCGTWPTKPGPAQTVPAVTRRPFLRLFSARSKEGFDGIYYVGGPLTASLPAVASKRRDDGSQELRQVIEGPAKYDPM